MTTLSSSTTYSVAATANLRTTGAELNGWLSTVGLVQTSDTGQVNWATVNLPAANTLIGYEIWRFADSSIYFKLEWTTGGTAGGLIFHLTVGTGSDGAGTITGAATFPRTAVFNVTNSAASTGTPWPTYICRTADFFGIVYKKGGPTANAQTAPAQLAFAIEKMVDASGTPTGDGFVVSHGTAGSSGAALTAIQTKRAIRTASTAAAYASNQSFCAVPANVTTTVVGSDRQVFLHAQPSPRAIFSNFLCTIIDSELPIATTFTATLLGTTSHTYISLGNGLNTGNSSSAATTWSTAMLWE